MTFKLRDSEKRIIKLNITRKCEYVLTFTGGNGTLPIVRNQYVNQPSALQFQVNDLPSQSLARGHIVDDKYLVEGVGLPVEEVVKQMGVEAGRWNRDDLRKG